MAASKIGRGGMLPVYAAATRSHAPLDSETIKLLAGRPKWLYEMACGETGGDTNHEPSASLNPNGRLGHDHSGPPYGSALQHPIFTYGGCASAAQFTSDDGTSAWAQGFLIVAGTATERDLVSFVAECWVRPFPEYDGSPYSKIKLYASWVSTPGSANITAAAWTNPDDRVDADTIVGTSQVEQDTGAYWTVKPGLNKLYGSFSTTDATDSTLIYGFSGNQIVKRSH